MSCAKRRAEVLYHFLVAAQTALSLRAYSWSGAVVGRVSALTGKAEQGKITWIVLACFLPPDIPRAYPSVEQKVSFVAKRGIGGGCEERRNDPSGA